MCCCKLLSILLQTVFTISPGFILSRLPNPFPGAWKNWWQTDSWACLFWCMQHISLIQYLAEYDCKDFPGRDQQTLIDSSISALVHGVQWCDMKDRLETAHSSTSPVTAVFESKPEVFEAKNFSQYNGTHWWFVKGNFRSLPTRNPWNCGNSPQCSMPEDAAHLTKLTHQHCCKWPWRLSHMHCWLNLQTRSSSLSAWPRSPQQHTIYQEQNDTVSVEVQLDQIQPDRCDQHCDTSLHNIQPLWWIQFLRRVPQVQPVWNGRWFVAVVNSIVRANIRNFFRWYSSLSRSYIVWLPFRTRSNISSSNPVFLKLCSNHMQHLLK